MKTTTIEIKVEALWSKEQAEAFVNFIKATLADHNEVSDDGATVTAYKVNGFETVVK